MTEFTLFPTIYKLMFEFLSSFYAWLGLFLSVSTIMLGKMCKNEAGRMYKLIKIQQTKKDQITATPSPSRLVHHQQADRNPRTRNPPQTQIRLNRLQQRQPRNQTNLPNSEARPQHRHQRQHEAPHPQQVNPVKARLHGIVRLARTVTTTTKVWKIAGHSTPPTTIYTF